MRKWQGCLGWSREIQRTSNGFGRNITAELQAGIRENRGVWAEEVLIYKICYV